MADEDDDGRPRRADERAKGDLVAVLVENVELGDLGDFVGGGEGVGHSVGLELTRWLVVVVDQLARGDVALR